MAPPRDFAEAPSRAPRPFGGGGGGGYGGGGYGGGGGYRDNNAPSANLSLEYSLTRRAVLALDFQLHHNDAARVDGFAGTAPVNLNSGTRDAFALAPALEYSWTPNIGVLAGVRVIFKGHHTEASITPAIAINYVH